jgi:hypothetical protein
MSQLFLDCDGVLADFDLCAEQVFGLPSREAEEQIGSDEFWLRIRSQENFYGRLPLRNDARELFEAVKHLKPVILTGCPRGGWAEPQKLEWAKQHFPETVMICTLSANKRNHMRPGDVLVDDYLKYRHLWEEAGGIFIHHTSAGQTIAELRRIGMLA